MLAAAARWRRDVRAVLVNALRGVAGYGVVLLLVVASLLCLLGGLGLPLLVRAGELAHRLADGQRARSGLRRAWHDEPDEAGGPPGWVAVRAALRRPSSWRTLLWLVSPLHVGLGLVLLNLVVTAAAGVLMPVLWAAAPIPELNYLGVRVTDLGSAMLAVPNGLVLSAVAFAAPRWFLGLERWQAQRLLGPTERALSARVEDLARSRTETLDGFTAELRRIERDLHDGAQARLVSLSMSLGMAQSLLEHDPGRAGPLLEAARVQARAASSELRALVRGIHPPLLADRGLAGALQAMAWDSPLPVEVDLRLDRQLSPPLESAVYFMALELMTNAVKHSGATSLRLGVLDRGDRLCLQVVDDGRGGADVEAGTGLRGVERRAAAFDGRVRVRSPLGGPTVVDVELPCGS